MFRPLAASLTLLGFVLLFTLDWHARANRNYPPEPDLREHAVDRCRLSCRAGLSLVVIIPEPRPEKVHRGLGALGRSVRVAALGADAFGVLGPGAPPAPGPLPFPLPVSLAADWTAGGADWGEREPASLTRAGGETGPARRTGADIGPGTAQRALLTGQVLGPEGRASASAIPVPAPIATFLAALALLFLLGRRTRQRPAQPPLLTRLAG